MDVLTRCLTHLDASRRRPATRPTAPAAGLSLVELLVVLIISGFLLGSVVPSFYKLIQETRLRSAVEHLMSGLQLARSEAIKRNITTVLCPSPDGEECDPGFDWTLGWIVFPSSNNREREDQEPLVWTGKALDHDIEFHTSIRRRRIVFQPRGTAAGTNASFTFCDARGVADPRVICLSNTGRARVSRKTCSGRPIVCGNSG